MSESVTRYGRTWSDGCPYRGAEPFAYAHREIFFGRQNAVNEMEEAIIENAEIGRPVILLTGVSGVGKTSLVEAGLAPKLAKTLAQTQEVGIFRRARASFEKDTADVFQVLADALVAEDALPELIQDGTPLQSIRQILEENPESCGIMLKGALALAAREMQFKQGLRELPRTRMLLFVDQLENLFIATQRDHEVRRTLLRVIASLSKTGLIWVVFALRSNFLRHCMQDPDMVDMFELLKTYKLQPPNPIEVSQVIRGPALASGLEFEEDFNNGIRLDGVIRESVGKEDSVLPLLERYLTRLYHAADIDEDLLATDRVQFIGFDAFQKTGSFEQFVIGEADAALEALPEVIQDAIIDVLRPLVGMSIGDQERVIRRFATYDEVADENHKHPIVEALIERNILVAGARQSNEPGVVLAHDCLIADWPLMREYIDENRDTIRMRAQLSMDTKRWQDSGNVEDYLLMGDRAVEEAQTLILVGGGRISDEEREFLEASQRKNVERAEKEESRKRMVQRIIAYAALLILIIGGVAGYQVFQEYEKTQAALQEKEEAERLAVLERAKLNKAQALVRQLLADLPSGDVDEARMRILTGVAMSDMASVLELARSQPDTPAGRIAKARSLKSFAEALAGKGEHAQAVEFFDRASAELQPLVELDAADDSLQYDVIHIGGGRARALLAIGEKDEGIAGLRAYITALSAFVLKRADAMRDELMQELEAAHEQLAGIYLQDLETGNAYDAHRAMIDFYVEEGADVPASLPYAKRAAVQMRDALYFKGAINLLNRAEEIAADLHEQEPGNLDHAVQYLDMVGQVAATHLAATDWQDALQTLERRRGLIGKLGDTFIGDTRILGMQGATLNAIGNIQRQAGNEATARRSFNDAVAINDKLVQTEPWEIRWREQLAESRLALGDIQLNLEDYPGARANLDSALEIHRVLLHRDPESPTLQAGLVATQLKLGHALFAQSDYSQAIRQFEQGLALRESLDEGVRRLVDAVQSPVEIQHLAGRAYEELGSWQQALDYFLEERQLRELKAIDTGRDPRSARRMADLCDALGRVYIRLGRQEEALPFLRQRMSILESLGEDEDSAVMGELYGRLARVLLATGKTAEASRLLDREADVLQKRIEQNPGNTELPMQLVAALEYAGESLAEAGAMAEAGQRYERAIDVMNPLAYTNQLNREEQVLLGEMNLRRASMAYHAGELKKAEASYGRAIQLLETAVGPDGGNQQWRVMLAKVYGDFADVLMQRGNTPSARSFIDKGMGFAQSLQGADPGNDHYQYLVAYYVHKLGQIAARESDADAAILKQEEALEMVRALLVRDKANTDYLELIASIHDQLGDIYGSTNRPKEALLSLQKRMPIVHALADEQPDNPVRQRALAMNYLKLGETLAGMGRQAQARDMMQRSIDVSQALVEKGLARDPASIGNLAMAYKSIGDLVTDPAEAPQAMDYYKKARETGEKAAGLDAGNPGWLILLANVNNTLGQLHVRHRQINEAVEAYEKSREALRRIVESAPYLSGWQNDLVSINGRLGDLYFGQNRWPNAREYYLEQLKLLREMLERGQAGERLRHERYVTTTRVGETLVQENNPGEALPYFQDALGYLQQLVTANPGDEAMQYQLAGLNNQMGLLMLDMGEPVRSRAYFQKGVNLLNMLAQFNDDEPQYRIDQVGALLNMLTSFSDGEIADGGAVASYFSRASNLLEPLQAEASLSPDQRTAVSSMRQTHRKLYDKFGL